MLVGMFCYIRKIIIRYTRTGYNMSVIRQTACLVVNPFTVDNFAVLFNCTSAGPANDGSGLQTILVGAWCSVFVWAHRGSTVGLLLLQRFNIGLTIEYSSWFISVLNLYLYVWCFCAFMSRSPSRGPNNLCVYEPQQNLGWGLLERKTYLCPSNLSF